MDNSTALAADRVIRSDVSALILTGGKATRLGGIAKHALAIDGSETILARLQRVVAPRVAEIVVSAAGDGAGELRAVPDWAPDIGPLAGVWGGLAEVRTPWLLVIAGDMPYLTTAVVELLLARVPIAWDGAHGGARTAQDPEIDAVGIRVGGLPEPLLCVLHARTRGVLEARLRAGRYKAGGLLTDEAVRVAWIDEAALRAVDPDLRALTNINTPADLGR